MSSTGNGPDTTPSSSTGTASGSKSGSAEPRSPEEIEADLARTREDLAETVDALGAKLDVKSRARAQVAATKKRATDQAQAARVKATDTVGQAKTAATNEDGKPVPAVLAGAGVLVLLGIVVPVLLGRRRRRRRLVLVAPKR